jgi:hypothetical protein
MIGIFAISAGHVRMTSAADSCPSAIRASISERARRSRSASSSARAACERAGRALISLSLFRSLIPPRVNCCTALPNVRPNGNPRNGSSAPSARNGHFSRSTTEGKRAICEAILRATLPGDVARRGDSPRSPGSDRFLRDCDGYERPSARWSGRFERTAHGVTLAALRVAVDALDSLADRPDEATGRLNYLCVSYGIR